VSIIVCCHNSAARVPKTLQLVAAQMVESDIPWEVLVVDNGSTDRTVEVAISCWETSGAPAPLRVVTQPELGLSHARAKGLAEARFEYLSFIDDDNWVFADWVGRVYNILADRPEVGACGGWGSAVFERTPPVWFEEHSASYAVGPQGGAEGYIAADRGFLYGAGLTIRRAAWLGIISEGFCSVLTGRKGASLTSGEDTEICNALVLKGWKLWYDPQLRFEHYMPASRLTWSYLRRLSRGFGASAAWLEIYREQICPSATAGFRTVPLPESACRLIRRSWLFQTYSVVRTLWSRRRDLAPQSEGSTETLQRDFEAGRIGELLKAALTYDWKAYRIRNARWNVIGAVQSPLLQRKSESL
jgi:GT2 family glycosyltransferase